MVECEVGCAGYPSADLADYMNRHKVSTQLERFSGMTRKWISGVIVGAILVLAACGGGGKKEATPAPAASAPSAQEAIAQVLAVTAHDLYYNEPDNVTNPPKWTVKAGEAFEIDLDNQGGLQHNWAIVKPGSDVPVPFDSAKNGDLLLWDAGLVDPGKSEKAQFTVTDPGIYKIICTVAGHYPSMQGQLEVK